MRSIVFLFAVLFVTPSEARAPRATVEAVADAIAEHYFDAGRGAGIAVTPSGRSPTETFPGRNWLETSRSGH